MSSQNALRDITRAANNIAITDSASFQSPVLSAPVSASGDNKSTLQTEQPTSGAPHYVMSTSASKSQTVQSRTSSKPLPPNSLDSGTSKRKNWMSSASKRLGLSNKKIRESTGTQSGFERLPVSPYASLKRPEVIHPPVFLVTLMLSSADPVSNPHQAQIYNTRRPLVSNPTQAPGPEQTTSKYSRSNGHVSISRPPTIPYRRYRTPIETITLSAAPTC
jgi:hypothetical protein